MVVENSIRRASQFGCLGRLENDRENLPAIVFREVGPSGGHYRQIGWECAGFVLKCAGICAKSNRRFP